MEWLTIAVIALVIFLLFLVVIVLKLPTEDFDGTHTDKKEVISNKQLNAVMSSEFSKTCLLNASELTLYKALCDHINKKLFPVLIFPQVSLGEILKSKDRMAFFSINSKRVDFLITDLYFNPVAVIEYQGSGHYKGNAKIRDEIKKVSCEKAGVMYLPVQERYSIQDLDTLLLSVVTH